MSSDIKVIDKAFKIIGCFDEKNKSASLKQIALITKLNKSTIIRICRSLIKHEFLIKNEIDGNYQLGFNSWKIGSTYNSTLNIASEMKSILSNICNETGMSASYWVKAGQKKICLYRVNSTSEINHYIPEGSTAPLVSASGKVLLAFLSDKKNIANELKKKGIPTSIFYPVSLHLQDCFQYLNYKKGDFPISEKACNEVISLPMNSFLTYDQINYVISEIKEHTS